ncbi:hypothetical protein TNCV_1102691 [Trichonephila clavipes]|nr:hypothetical protein TNCV_1102691 [Trichonephila clavipes]
MGVLLNSHRAESPLEKRGRGLWFPLKDNIKLLRHGFSKVINEVREYTIPFLQKNRGTVCEGNKRIATLLDVLDKKWVHVGKA